MNKFIKYLILFIFSLNLLSSNDMDTFFLLQKEKDSLSKNIKLINSIYSLGYQEKAKQKLYILLDKYNKKDFDKNINKILKLINKNNFDISIINSLEFIIDKKDKRDKKPLDTEIINIYKAKGKDKATPYPMTEASTHRKDKAMPDPMTKALTPPKDKVLTRPKDIEMAIVLSESLDDLDIDNSLRYSLILSNDPYFSIMYQYLNYMKNKKLENLEKINKKSPLYYHLLISIYKNNNKEKAQLYLDKIKKEYPQYLKYNRINL